ncbi:undecaprenyldiphospho-muramoylpentapeptide beta-N-acetylglucosaminyltransferase [Parasediminibacterium sp. JCM 36343]|uniref:undecaprenyldiphospho-muramoylpentapeptide beta-N-acetylglucosaminyltransferase n=1 Tax=Parasediminibacterium sp. JCM 36343 TaxID=3374279 RepID=UPI0039794CAF
MMRRLIIAGGGTGGHIFPAIAIANAVKKINPDVQILFIGATGKMEMEKVPEAGYEIKGITIAGYNRSSLIKNIWLPSKIAISFVQVRRIMNSFKPDAVLGVGGYSTFPVLRYAQGRGIPTYIHESNSFAGKSNVLLGRKATKIFVAWEGMQKFFPGHKIMLTGNPIRSAIAHSTVTKKDGLDFFGLKEGLETVLVVGGSLGASSINEAVAHHLPQFEQKGLQLIWQTGKIDADKYQALAVGNEHIWVGTFIKQMEMAYAAATYIVSRAGAMAVAELCVVGKPAILVPYPFAAEDHQTANAMSLVANKAAVLLKDSEVEKYLMSELSLLISDPERSEEMSKNINALCLRDADEVVAREINSP